MITIENAQIFFYLAIGICTIIVTIIYCISTIIISKKISKTIKRVSTIVREVEEKINIAKQFIENIKESLVDAEFYLSKIEKISEYFGDITGKNDEHEEHKRIIKKKKK